jgi:TPP-dependent pyruvate/acetoin dehydrogenase alpha subunit
MADPDLYRTKEEIEDWKKRDPIVLLEGLLRERGGLTDARLAELESAIAAELDEAIAIAEAGPLEPVEDLTKDVHTPVEGGPS